MTRDALTARWTDIGEKLVALAESFPEERFDFRPTAETRSFAEQLRHVAFWNAYAHDSLRGRPTDGEANELPADRYATKPAIVSALRSSVDDVATTLAAPGRALQDGDHETVVSFIEHNGEHYGQLVMYYRLNGLVPPASL
ncbi:MAG TPA: DinB family protein [Gemmatimonadaceae bacterium]|nr:DinB family protein [Gemmatimonadaceae bacterium]